MSFFFCHVHMLSSCWRKYSFTLVQSYFSFSLGSTILGTSGLVFLLPTSIQYLLFLNTNTASKVIMPIIPHEEFFHYSDFPSRFFKLDRCFWTLQSNNIHCQSYLFLQILFLLLPFLYCRDCFLSALTLRKKIQITFGFFVMFLLVCLGYRVSKTGLFTSVSFWVAHSPTVGLFYYITVSFPFLWIWE